MATTEKGIYYQDDHKKAADILADMKRMAESTDDAIKKSEYNDKDVKDSIKEIQDKQTLQDKNIEKNTTKNTQQDELIQKLQNNMIQESTEEATSLHVEDASDLPAKLNIKGSHYQEQQEETDNLAVLTEGTIERDGNKIIVENGIATLSGSNQSSATNYIKVGTAYLYKGKKYYINNIRSLTAGSHGALLRGSTTKWFTANTELEWECPKTGEWDIEITYSAGQFAAGTEKFLISETSKATWIQGKKAIPSVEYPSEISTIKDNIKIIQCNKNFFNVNSKNIGGVDLTLQEDGKYKINGNATSSWTFREGEKTLLEKGDYTLSVETEKGTFNGFFGIRGSDNIKYETKGEIHISLTEDKIITCYFTCSGTATFDNVVVKVQLEKSKVKTEWVKHEEKVHNITVQQEMLQNDKFDLLNNKEVHVWKKLILNGTENWQQSSVYNNVFYLVINDMMTDINKAELISNQYKYEGYITDTAEIQNNKCYTYKQYQFTNNKAVYVRNDNFTTLESFKASLAEKNMTLYYVSDTTTELDLTEEQKETLNQLNNLELFKGINNIYTEQDLALLQLNYTADTKMYIDNKISSQNKEILNVAGGN